MNRREFLRNATAFSGAIAGLEGLIVRGARGMRLRGGEVDGSYGELFPKKAINTGETFLALPIGFQYTVFGRAGSKMGDGATTPIRHDGMGAFAVGGKIRLMRNHEVSPSAGKPNACIGKPEHSYDTTASAGVTALVVNPRTRELERDFAILSGTVRNCAGGTTPWGSWISCEETVTGKLHFFDRGEGVRYGSFAREHGYCFEVPAASDSPAPPKPLKAMGRFVHEAVAVDPRTDIVYETEDRNPSGFYRFLPHQRKKLEAGGRLQMLRVAWKDNYDTRIRQAIGSKIRCTWVDIANPDPANVGEDDAAVYKQGFAKGGATFNRLEGCFFANGHIFMSATQGGNRNLGQVWRYTPEGDDEGVLVLLFESYDPEILNMPDNICLSKRGGLVICEDNNNNRPNFVRGLTPEGKVFDFAKNIALGKDMTEFSGVTFSPDGETLFLNMFGLGVTCAIWGDWKAGCL